MPSEETLQRIAVRLHAMQQVFRALDWSVPVNQCLLREKIYRFFWPERQPLNLNVWISKFRISKLKIS